MQASKTQSQDYSIVFLDMIGFSQKPMLAQIQCRDRFNAILGSALKPIQPDGMVQVETGEGAVIALPGQADKALFLALNLRNGLMDDKSRHEMPLQVRIAINTGPLELGTGINDQPIITGQGINLAQAVMHHGNPEQILVSAAYLDTILKMPGDFISIFAYEAVKTKKSEAAAFLIHFADSAVPPAMAQADAAPAAAVGERPSVSQRLSQLLSRLEPQTWAMMGLMAIFIGILSWLATSTAPLPDPTARPEIAVDTSVDSVNKTTAGAAKPAVADKLSAVVQFAVTPWGEVYIDGVKQGVAPPLTSVKVSPGTHEIEIRNPNAPVYQGRLELKAGEEFKIKHRFR